MRYLAISRAPNFLAYATFDDEVLSSYYVEQFRQYDSVSRMKEVYDALNRVYDAINPSIVITHHIDYNKTMKKDLERLSEIKTLIKLACIENKVVYIEAKTSGWEKKILGRVTKANKLKLIKDGYGEDLETFEPYSEDIADAIILGEAVAHRRLHA